MAKAAFLDTMIYLHFKPVEELPWPELLEADHVHILVPRITLGELDKHKDSHSQRKIRDRALRILKRIETWSAAEAAQLREAVDIQLYTRLPRIDFSEYDLDPTRNDDVLIATALDYQQQHPDVDVVLVTQDTTPRIVARGLGIAVLKLPDELKLPVEQDPVEQENRDLRKQLEKLQGAAPKLGLQFDDGESGNRLLIKLEPPLEEPEAYVRMKIDKLREEYPHRQRQPSPFGAMATPHENEYTRYNADRQRYFTAYEQYLLSDWTFEKQRRLTFEIALEITNDGSTPAEDVDVYLDIPDTLTVVVRKDDEEAPAPPPPPRLPRTETQILTDRVQLMVPSHSPLMRDFSALTSRPEPPPNVSPPKLGANQRSHAEWSIQRVKHKQVTLLPPLMVAFNDYDAAGSLGLNYRIYAANLPDEVAGALHVIVEKVPW